MNEVVREFLLETDENLAQLDLDLLALEKNPYEKETVARAFRTLHTVKGTAGFLGLEKLQAVSHAAENLLSKVRSGELTFGPPIAGALLAVVDAIREIMRRIEAEESEGDRDDGALIALLEALTRGESFGEPPANGGITSSDTEQLAGLTRPPDSSANLAATMALPPGGLELPPTEPRSVVDTSESPLFETSADAAKPTKRKRAPRRPKAEPRPTPTVAPPATSTPMPPTAPASDSPELRGATVAESAIRVDVGLLDKLMNVVGELVLTRNRILQHTAASQDAVLHGTVQRLNLLTTELQAGVMKTRMQPVGAVWGKFPRLVRDLAVACGKQVRFEMEGYDTELDKTVLEAIRDPLTHMVRNAVDHGVEAPAVRAAAGKPAEGSLRLHAFHEGGKVVVEIADDGGGIDPKRVRDKAVRQGLVSSAAADRLSERDVLELIFKPGFTTSENVTQFSGRGVGMDVVRTNVERIGGMVDLESELGVGTKFRMKIPLTLAIVPALVVGAAGERFAIPQASLLELVFVGGDRTVEYVHGAPVYRLRGQLLPLAFLDRELGLTAAADRPPSDGLLVVVLQAEDRQFGLVVDTVLDTEEIVVKPLQRQLKSLNAYAGATVMGDGRVALILDVMGLAKRAGLEVGQGNQSRWTALAPSAGVEGADRTLIFSPRAGGRMALSLAHVARLEEFPRSAVEAVGGRSAVQYRGSIMPLVSVDELLGGPPTIAADGDASLPVVVHERDGKCVGLAVGSIVDIVEEAPAARTPALRSGVSFNGVLRGAVTEFLDVPEVLRRAERLLTADGAGTVA